MATNAQNKATAKYRAENVRQIVVRFYPSEADILEYIEGMENKAGYIKELIRADMENKKATR